MSYPANPLDKFQSYSYHHFLIAANNTESLRQIEDNKISFSSLAKLKHGEFVTAVDGKSKVVMVMNSAVDSKFYIESFDYTALFVGVQDSTAKLTQATELNMVVKESTGATFINFLRRISDEYLETSYGSVCFLIKTFFVGHTTSGGATEMIETKPITLLLGNMDSQFDASGSTHALKFYGLTNGAPLKNDHLHYVNRNLNLITKENSILLKDLIEDLESKLNKQLDEQWKLVKIATGGNGRKVQYRFTIPENWSNYTVKSMSKDNYVERLFEKEQQAVKQQSTPQKTTGEQNKPGVESDLFKTSMNSSVKTTVTQILSEIFKHCDQIHEAFIGNQQLPKDKQFEAKLHQVVTSITSDANTVTVHFDTVNYYLPKLPNDQEKAIIQKITEENLDGAKDAEFDKYGITFEYIFTGKNSDILNIELKANHTNTILLASQTGVQKATGNMTATDKSVQTASKDQKIIKPEGKEASPTMTMRKYDAVYLPENPSDGQHGYIYAAPDSAKLRTKYINQLAFLTAISTQNMHITIRGNPNFVNQIVRPLLPHNEIEYKKKLIEFDTAAHKKVSALTGPHDEAKSISSMGEAATYVPMFVKVNIKTPIFDETTGNITSYEPFWYRGRYRITSIKNSFINGQFTQDLFLLPYDLKELAT
jgi:hypothetical protein